MANIVYMAKSAWTGLLDTIRSKASVSGTMTVSEATTAVENIETGGGGDETVDSLIDRNISKITTSALRIGSFAFASAMSLSAINAPLCEKIYDSAFCYCKSINSIYFPNTSLIGRYAFQSCALSEFTGDQFPKVLSISTYAFADCSLLTTIRLNNSSACSIDTRGFAGCSRLETLEGAFKGIGESAFIGCTSLKTVNTTLTSYIGAYAFSNCSALESINLLSLKAVNSAVFSGCINLSFASFQSVSRIQSSAFYGCFNLLTLYLMSTSVVTLMHANAFWSTPISTYTTSTGGVHGSIFVPASLYNSYLTATNWSTYSSRIVSVAE